MKNEESERDRLGQHYIAVWKDCAQPVSKAIKEFRECWMPYSVSSRRYSILHLIEKVIDPATTTYLETLPARYMGYVPGAGTGVGFSAIIRLVGLEAMARMQRQLLRQFIKTEDRQTPKDRCFIATLESLIGLIADCVCKRPKNSVAITGVNLNAQRKHDFCEFCGSLTEFAVFMATVAQKQTNDTEFTDHKKLELSHHYCIKHRPKLKNDKWNPAYKQAKRSLSQFNIELSRLRQQCANRSKPHAMSGDRLIDNYFFQFMLSQTLQSADKAELRNLARRMVDSKLSDNKKKMLVLQQFGFNQQEIAQQLLNKKQQPMTRQAVSKALPAIREEFLLKTGKTPPKF